MRKISVFLLIAAAIQGGAIMLTGAQAGSSPTTGTMTVTSPDFKEGQMIPPRFTCDGESVNPGLVIENIPKDAKSLAMIVDDPDAPGGTFTHWVMYNVPVTSRISTNSQPGIQGQNSKKRNGYAGPCPPAGETHRYFFKVYALDNKLNLKAGADKKTVEQAMQGHVLATGQLVGLYKKQ